MRNRIQATFLLLGLMTAGRLYGFEGLAVLGDSLSTGAASHPVLEFDAKVLWDVFNGTRSLAIDPLMIPEEFRGKIAIQDAPARLKPSSRENDGGSGWIWHHFVQSVSARTLEAHQLSYGYFAGRALGIPAGDILIGGENGTASRHAWIHAARLVGARKRELPSKIVFFYTGNDLCAQSFDEITETEEYGRNLLKGMKYLALNGHADARGTRIYIPGFLPVTTILHEPAILAKKISLHGDEVTCQEARERLFAPSLTQAQGDVSQDPKFQVFSVFMPPSPSLLCPTLFGKATEDSVRQSMLANRIRAYREEQRRVVERFNDWRGHKFPAKTIEAVYIPETESIRFDGGDIAGDCFHLSAAGQGKVAASILGAMR